MNGWLPGVAHRGKHLVSAPLPRRGKAETGGRRKFCLAGRSLAVNAWFTSSISKRHSSGNPEMRKMIVVLSLLRILFRTARFGLIAHGHRTEATTFWTEGVPFNLFRRPPDEPQPVL